jgi:uncharacterized protein
MADMNRYESSSVAEQTFIQQVYQWMGAGLALTGALAMWAANTEWVLRGLLGGGFLVLMLVELGIVFWLSASILKISAQTAVAGFLVYSALNGISLCYIFLIYTGASIASTFFITAGTFAAVSLFGWTTKSDLTSVRGFLVMGLIGVLIASLVNIFLKSTALDWVISYAGLAVFIGLTAYDTQRLKEIHQSGSGSTGQMAILGALKLYLDFINMFLFLLRIFGRRRD